MTKELQGIIAQMLKPLKGLPLKIVIEGLSGYKVIPFDKNDTKDKKVLEILQLVAEDVLNVVNQKGILRNRPNEVGNDIEPFVKDSLRKFNYDADTSMTISGNKKSSGYPDIEFQDNFGRYHYLECKTFNIENIATTQRSFYLSPSNDFKITKNAHHFGISFEIFIEENLGDKHLFKVRSWKILDLSQLQLNVKHEFNSDNRHLYDKKLILSEK